jgi:molybdenum ABC transporter molybdate-binding protein
VRVWVDRQGEAVLGKGRAELLEAIDQRRSITAAAKAAGLSYRKAWMVVQEVNEAAGQALVEAAVGGLHGGGARLTEQGRFAVDVYWQLHRVLEAGVGKALRKLVASPAAVDKYVRVAAAISLQEALSQILAAFALRRPAIHVRAMYGASNELADQLAAGARGNVFISADGRQIERLAKAGMVDPGTRRVVALNGLAAIGRRAARKTTLRRLVAGTGRIALAEPACPLGRYTHEYLESVRVLEQVLSRAMYVDNSRGVVSAVLSGVADAGIAFASDAAHVRDCTLMFQIPRTQTGVKYVAAALEAPEGREESRELLEFLSSAEAVRCWRRCGLRSPVLPRSEPRSAPPV